MPNTGKQKPKPVTPENMRQMALDVINYLIQHEMFYMVDIYAGRMHYSDDYHTGQEKDENLVPGHIVYVEEYDMAKCPCEYNNPDTLTMTFEGSLYHAINYCTGTPTAYKDLNEIFENYGLYLEQGYAWSLACYPE